MFSLLTIIYIAFISLGLPDSLLGSAWPVMRAELNVPVSYAGLISMIIAGGTIVSSLMADRVIKKIGTGAVTAVSVGMTALALFGFSVSDSYISLLFWAVPYGLGAGAVDAALNNYVAVHYSSRHMNWLHAFWGVGVSVSPYIMGKCLKNSLGWKAGYRSVSIIQIVLTVILFFTLFLWKKEEKSNETEKGSTLARVLKIKGVKETLVMFFGFCALEATAGLWASSYLAEARGVDVKTAASFASLFYIGETAGRFLNGFVADKFGDKAMIKAGIFGMLLGTVMIFVPGVPNTVALAGLITVGLGAAPVYPCIIHSTPYDFGTENSQALVGIQMASAYVGSTLAPPVFGFIAQYVSISLYPVYLFAFAVLMLAMDKSRKSALTKNS